MFQSGVACYKLQTLSRYRHIVNTILSPNQIWKISRLSQRRHLNPLISARTIGSTSSERKLEEYKTHRYQTNSVDTPNFANYREAFKNKTTGEVLRAFLVFSLFRFGTLVNNQLKILQWLRRILGKWLFCKLMRATLYGQFLAGEEEKEVLNVANRHATCRLNMMFAYTAGEVHGGAKSMEEAYRLSWNNNLENIHLELDMAAKSQAFSDFRPKVTTKFTFLTDANTLTVVSNLIISNNSIIDGIEARGQTEASLYHAFREFLQSLEGDLSGRDYLSPNKDWYRHLTLPSLKTSLAFHLALESRRKDLQTFSKMSSPGPHLTDHDKAYLADIWTKTKQLGKHALESEVSLLWDAEQSYMEPAIELLTLDCMRMYNTTYPVIHNAYQCYLKRAYDLACRDLELAKREGFCLGIKLVRGAYLDEERMRAETLGYEDPINPSYDATTDMYHRVAEMLLRQIKEFRYGDMHITFATHNEDTVKHVLFLMRELGIAPDGHIMGFAQLLGMRDHITFPLGQHGIPAAKLLHYGPVEEGLAYLSRRALENKSVIPTANHERRMLASELWRRMTHRNSQ